MTIDQLPGVITTKTRDRVMEEWKRSHRLRVPEADTGEGTQPHTDASIAADALMPLYAAAVVTGENAVLEEARGEAVDQWGDREGVGARREAFGASGFVLIKASPGGGTIPAGDELIYEEGTLRFEVVSSDHYDDGDQCAIVGKDTGPSTNLPAGTQLKWTSQQPGIGATVTVIEQNDGSGLSGGRDRESDDEYKARIEEEKRTRAASGNDAEYQLKAQSTPGVAVQKAFSYPAITGTLTTCIVFTTRAARSGGSRVPNPAQVALVEAHVVGEMPADDGPAFGLLVNENADISYGVEWTEDAPGWEDLVQWPPFYEVIPLSGAGAIRVGAAASATVFTLITTNVVYSGVQQPRVGQTIGFYDTDGFAFRRKRILSFTGTGPWVVTCDTTNNVSDTSYTPVVGQRAMPWSQSLPALLTGIWAYFDTLGPGEQVASFYDEGRRQRRIPRPPKEWPHTLTTRGLLDAITALEVADVESFEGDGLAPSVGTPGILSNILKLRFVSIFAGT